MRVLFTGGGTGGHLFPGLAICDEWLRRHGNTLLLFVGTQRGIESRIVPERGIPFRTVWISGLHRGRLWGNMLFPIKMTVSLIQSLFIILKFKPDVVIGTGGYVTWPVIKAAQLLRKMTVLQEQNEAPGLVIGQLAGKATQVHLSFEASTRHFARKDNLFFSGNPTREGLSSGERQQGLTHFGLDPERRTLFIFGGSQGALGLNHAVVEALDPLMRDPSLQILWGTGPRWIEQVKQAAAPWRDRICALPFIDRMDLAYGAADLLLCRSGATTVAEITRLGLPAIYMPLPTAAAGHQEQNARVIEKIGGGRVLLQGQADARTLTGLIHGLIHDEAALKNMAVAAATLAKPNAARDIVTAIEAAMQKNEA